MEMEEMFSSCNSLRELIQTAADLKNKGEDPAKVNKLLKQYREQLMKSDDKKYNAIHRNSVNTTISEQPTVFFNIQVDSPTSAHLTVRGDTIIL